MRIISPKCYMYEIFTYIWTKFMVNVNKYFIHEAYGTHSIHGTDIFTDWFTTKNQPNVGKYAIFHTWVLWVMTTWCLWYSTVVRQTSGSSKVKKSQFSRPCYSIEYTDRPTNRVVKVSEERCALEYQLQLRWKMPQNGPKKLGSCLFLVVEFFLQIWQPGKQTQQTWTHPFPILLMEEILHQVDR